MLVLSDKLAYFFIPKIFFISDFNFSFSNIYMPTPIQHHSPLNYISFFSLFQISTIYNKYICPVHRSVKKCKSIETLLAGGQ